MDDAPIAIEKTGPEYRGAYDAHGFLCYGERRCRAVSAWVVQDHPDFRAAFASHGDRTDAGMDRTLAMLQRLGWRQTRQTQRELERQQRARERKRKQARLPKLATLVPLDVALIAGWSSGEAALANEWDHAWLPTAHAGVVARIEGGEPEIDPRILPDATLLASPVRRCSYESERVHAWSGSRITALWVTANPIYLFGDQTEDIRRRAAKTLWTGGGVDPRWRPVVEGWALGTDPDLPRPEIPHGEWRMAIERMLDHAGVGALKVDDLEGRLDGIAGRHELLAQRIADGRQQDPALTPARRQVRDAIVQHGGGTPDAMAPVAIHRLVAREAAALARSVRLFMRQTPPGPAVVLPEDPLI